MTISIAPRGAPRKSDGDIARDPTHAPIPAADSDWLSVLKAAAGEI